MSNSRRGVVAGNKPAGPVVSGSCGPVVSSPVVSGSNSLASFTQYA